METSESSSSVSLGLLCPHGIHRSTMFGMPLPAFSPTRIRENILRTVLLRASDVPPTYAYSTPTRKQPGLVNSSPSAVHRNTTPLLESWSAFDSALTMASRTASCAGVSSTRRSPSSLKGTSSA